MYVIFKVLRSDVRLHPAGGFCLYGYYEALNNPLITGQSVFKTEKQKHIKESEMESKNNNPEITNVDLENPGNIISSLFEEQKTRLLSYFAMIQGKYKVTAKEIAEAVGITEITLRKIRFEGHEPFPSTYIQMLNNLNLSALPEKDTILKDLLPDLEHNPYVCDPKCPFIHSFHMYLSDQEQICMLKSKLHNLQINQTLQKNCNPK